MPLLHDSKKLKKFDGKKCPIHLVSLIKHDDLFVPYIIVHIFLF